MLSRRSAECAWRRRLPAAARGLASLTRPASGWFQSMFGGDDAPAARPSPEPEVDRAAIAAAAVELAHTRAPFEVQKRRSAIEGGGFGVFLRGGPVAAGTAVVLYPGRYTPPPPDWAVTIDGPCVITVPADNEDEKKAYTISLRNQGGFMDGFEVEEALHKGNPFAVAQFVNHPRAGVLSNVFPVDFAWDPAAVAAALLPNAFDTGFWFADPGTGDPVPIIPAGIPLCGLSFVAMRQIEVSGEQWAVR